MVRSCVSIRSFSRPFVCSFICSCERSADHLQVLVLALSRGVWHGLWALSIQAGPLGPSLVAFLTSRPGSCGCGCLFAFLAGTLDAWGTLSAASPGTLCTIIGTDTSHWQSCACIPDCGGSCQKPANVANACLDMMAAQNRAPSLSIHA